MEIIDTHTHIYSKEFDNDRDEVISTCEKNHIKYLILPNVDLESKERLNSIVKKYPHNCIPLMGLHPCSVGNDYKTVLTKIGHEYHDGNYAGVGEIGLDLYWDKTYRDYQADAFITQCRWAAARKQPVSIHTRDAIFWALEILKKEKIQNLTGVFHCFTGSYEEGMEIIKLGFALGVGGVVTYKNTQLRETLSKIPLENLVLETDAPYLSPVPFRGKRNQPLYLKEIITTLSQVYNCSPGEIAQITSNHARKIFNL